MTVCRGGGLFPQAAQAKPGQAEANAVLIEPAVLPVERFGGYPQLVDGLAPRGVPTGGAVSVSDKLGDALYDRVDALIERPQAIPLPVPGEEALLAKQPQEGGLEALEFVL